MASIDRSQRCVGTLLLSLAFIQYATQPFYSASAASRSRPGTNRIGNPAVPDMDQARTAKLARRTEVPVIFEANWGQADSEFKFISRSSGETMLISPRRAVITMRVTQPPPARQAGPLGGETELRSTEYQHISGEQSFGNPERGTVVLRDTGAAVKSCVASVEMKLLGATAFPEVEGVDQQKGKANYLIGKDPAAWHTGIQMFGGVRERSVYPGIDLVFHGSRELEYDFVLAPGANPDKIALAFRGAYRVQLDGDDLVLSTPAGELRQPRPIAYQEVDGVRRNVASRYEIRSKGRGRIVRFRLGSYDRRLPLVIDPSLVYSGLVAGTGGTTGGSAVDASGNCYITGVTNPAQFPTTVGGPNPSSASSMAFLAKFDPDGGLIYSTIFGGSVGAGGSGVAVDAQGNAYVVGGTGSNDFPVTQGAFQARKMTAGVAGFVMKVNSSGSGIVYSTFLSGSNQDTARYVAIDGSGNGIVAGLAGSRDFPTTPGAFQTVVNRASLAGILDGAIFVAKLNPTGSALVYSTFLDGSDGPSGDAYNFLSGIAADSPGNAYIAGTTGQSDFPTTPGSFQPHRYGITARTGGVAFATKINPSGSGLVYSTLIGDATNGNGIAADNQGDAYVAGTAQTDDFPAVNAIQGRIRGGALVKTTDGGESSANVSNGLPVLGSGSHPVVDPSNPSRVFTSAAGKLFRTENGGDSWSLVGGGLPADAYFVIAAIDSLNPTTVFAVTRSPSAGALFVSNDRGDNWHLVSTVPDGGQIAIDPKTPSTIYATTSTIHNGVSTGTTLVKSVDGGSNWSSAGQGLPAGSVLELTIDPVNTSNLYAGTLAGLFKSSDAGGHWSGTDAKNQVNSIAIDPRTPTTIYALDIGPRQFYIASAEGRGHSKKRAAQNDTLDGVIRSDDGGATWSSINTGLFVGMSLAALAVDPADGTVYLGAFEGLFKSTDQGRQWVAPADLASHATFSIGVDPRNKGTLYLGGEIMNDAFVTKLAPDGASALYSTLLGGMAQDDARCIAVDAAGNVFVAGATNSGNFPVTPNAFQRNWSGLDNADDVGDDVYLAEINAAGTAVLYATYIGGSRDEEPFSIAVDASGNPVISGLTQSDDFPTKDPGGRPFFSHSGRTFVLKIATSGTSSRQPQIANASVSGKRLTVQGDSFDQGAVIMIGGADLPTINDTQNPSSMLLSKKGGKRITPGQQVTIQVRNSDGSMSNPYSYTRPSN